MAAKLAFLKRSGLLVGAAVNFNHLRLAKAGFLV
jgi:hypothetical protein